MNHRREFQTGSRNERRSESKGRTVAPGRGEKHWRSKSLEARLPVRKKPTITAAAAASHARAREPGGGE
jgi:hypothetical protein